MYIPTCSRGFIVALIASALSGALAGCSVEDQSTPAFTGPSEFALSVTMSATPDQLPRDGSAQSVVTVTVRDASNTPAEGQRLTVTTNIGTVSQSEIVTAGDGHATFAFITPATGTVGNAALILVVLVSNGGDAAQPRVLTIALTGASNSTAPSPAFTVTPTAPEKNASVRFDASTTTDEGVPCLDACTYSWNFGDGATGTGRIASHAFAAPGTYTVALTVSDAAGASASTAQAVTVTNVAAPTVTLAVTPSPPAAGQAATFTATATPASGHGISSYAWNFGDGSTTQTTTGPTVTKTYSKVGTYVVTVTVTDDLGQTASVSLQFTIVGSGVTASFTSSPTDPKTTTTVQFNGVASTASAGATITEWNWDFGDGSVVNANNDPTTSHQFAAVGTYVVRLTVTDSAGRTGTVTTNVVVT